VYEFYSSSPITGFLLAGYIGTTLYIKSPVELCGSIFFLAELRRVLASVCEFDVLVVLLVILFNSLYQE
jgi:hypothetical protein